MSFTFRYSARVFDDLKSGYDYYIERSNAQVAERFIQEIERTLNNIKENPYTFTTRYKDIRCGIPKTFPYLIHYKILEDEKEILFIAVANTHQQPLWNI